MPGPILYVAVVIGVIGTVAAGFAFKEYVYEPHIAPQFEAWNEERRRARSRRGAVAVPVKQNENDVRKGPGPTRPETPENDPMSVELEDLVAREAAEWQSSPSGRPQGSLRRRNPHNVIEESNVFIPYDPMAPTQVVFDSSDTESSQSFTSARSPAARTRSVSPPPAPAVVNPSPRQPASAGFVSPSIRPSQSILPMSPRLPTPISNVSQASSRATSPTNSQLYHSASSASSFTPAVIGPYSASSRNGSSIDAMSDAGRSARSNQGSRVTSPFSDIHAVQAIRSPGSPFVAVSPNGCSGTAFSDVSSPLILSPNIGSDYSLPSDTEEGLEGMVLSPSLRSGMFSPSVDLGREMHDDPFEVGSVHGSETDSWDSFGRRTPEV
ncbi:hypothetical protein EUX98_g4303 [Antrodiella citrinella]|uniref:Transmembrane protein n=1 Tax=Antrodiella citrinella TaxID=2447956 RepID=A0A4S4MUA1_9APHY|nr:hypothetical protein EUX98_g4303 [Antrodiella citrinella]